MSNRWLNAAWPVECDSPSQKLLLIALADSANNAGRCWRSVETLAAQAGLSEKQARRLLHALADKGHVSVVANSQGGFRKARVYQLTIQNTPADGSVSEGVAGSETLPPVSHNPPAHVPKPSRRREGNHKEPLENLQEGERARAAPAPDRPPEVSEQVWSDWLALRKSKKAGISLTAIEAAASEAGKARVSLDDYLQQCVLRDHLGLPADWIKPTATSSASRLPAWRIAENRRMQQLCPSIAERLPGAHGHVIDVDDATTISDVPEFLRLPRSG